MDHSYAVVSWSGQARLRVGEQTVIEQLTHVMRTSVLRVANIDCNQEPGKESDFLQCLANEHSTLITNAISLVPALFSLLSDAGKKLHKAVTATVALERKRT